MSPPSSQTPAQILQKFYDAEAAYMAAPEGTGDVTEMAASLSEHMKLTQSSDLIWGGVYDGVEGFRKWGEVMTIYFDRLEVTNPQVFENKDSNRVLVHSLLKLRVRRTGEQLERPLVQVVQVDKEKGVIEEIRPFYWDVGGLNKALGA